MANIAAPEDSGTLSMLCSYGKLGNAAFKARQREVAEKYFLKLRDDLANYHRFEEMSMLAEIWHDRDAVKGARELLVDCTRKIIIEIKEGKYNSDREMFADEISRHSNALAQEGVDTENEAPRVR